MDRKMTDDEIVKALPTIYYGGHSCMRCKYKINKGNERCGIKGCNIARNALDLINRQKAEIEKNENIIRFADKTIEKQSAEIERLKHLKCLYSSDGIELRDCIMGDCFYRTTEWEVKSEAIKEFAERFRKELFDEIRKTIWNIDVPLEYEQNKSYVLSRVWRCIKNKLEELVGD